MRTELKQLRDEKDKGGQKDNNNTEDICDDSEARRDPDQGRKGPGSGAGSGSGSRLRPRQGPRPSVPAPSPAPREPYRKEASLVIDLNKEVRATLPTAIRLIGT